MSDKHCPFCNESEDFRRGKEIMVRFEAYLKTFLHIDENELFVEEADLNDVLVHRAKFPINYCPICGRKVHYTQNKKEKKK